MSSHASKENAMPLRTTMWSSTTRSRVRPSSVATVPSVRFVPLDEDLGAAIWRTGQREGRANAVGALAHELESHVSRLNGAGVETPPVVRNAQGCAGVTGAHMQSEMSGASLPGNLVERIVRYAVHDILPIVG